MQNKIIRIMNFKHLSDRVKMCTLYKSMNTLLMNDVHELDTAKFVHSFYHCMLPKNFDTYFRSSNAQHSYNTRSYHCRRLLSGKSFYKEWAVVMHLCWRKILE